jgi:hypothetical protein
VTDFRDQIRHDIDSRLAELKPLVKEYNCLEMATQAVAGVPGSLARAREQITRETGETDRSPSGAPQRLESQNATLSIRQRHARGAGAREKRAALAVRDRRRKAASYT